MKNVLITFGGAQYDDTIKDLVEKGPKLGATDVWIYDDVWLSGHDFFTINKWLWDHPVKRGFGWYAWKPFVIIHALSKLSSGDAVLFVDADCRPVADFSALFTECRNAGGIMLVEAEPYNQRQWCKRDCYIVMGQDQTKYWDAPHVVARYMAFAKGWKSEQFLYEWLTYCVNPLANTLDKSVIGPELDGFIEHRAEQAILTNLAHKYKCRLHPELCRSEGSIFEHNFNPSEIRITLDVIGSKYRTV